jgi:hypothetical protein
MPSDHNQCYYVISIIIKEKVIFSRTEDHMQQLVAAEALIAATQKKKDSSFIVSNGVEILKQLYRSKNDHIKVIFLLIKNQKCYCYFS